MTDMDGVHSAAGEKLDTMTVEEAERLIADGHIKGGMVPEDLGLPCKPSAGSAPKL